MGPLATTFLEFARVEARRAPLYAAMASTIAHDAEILRLFADTPDLQRRPVLFFAALHRQVLYHPESPLAACYPTVTRGVAQPERAAGLVVGACAAWADDLRHDLSTRVTQTNEIGRAGAVVAGISHTTGLDRRPVALLELGASAGLLLAADRYRIRFGAEIEYGPPDSSVTVEIVQRGGRPPAGPHPPIGWRRGVDLAPVDVRDADQRRWLEACCWAEDLDRFDRLRAALALVAIDPPPVERGDALAELPRLLADVPADHHLVVLNAWALTYLEPEHRSRVAERLRRAGQDRDLTWLSIESPAETPELPRPDRPLRHPAATDLVALTTRNGRTEVTRLAELHPHGRWVDWLSDAPVTELPPAPTGITG